MERVGGVWDSIKGNNRFDISYLPIIGDIVGGIRDTFASLVDSILGTAHSKK